MTFKELMLEQTGYECFTTFFEDFTTAEKFGLNAVKDTFNRAFKEWKSNYKYLTELTMVLNWKIWQHYEKNVNSVFACVLDVNEVEEFLKLGYILLVKKRVDVNTETSYNFNQKPYIVKEYHFGAKI